MKPLFESAPRRKYATAYTLVASLLLHGSIVGVAALWPNQPEPAKILVTQIGDAPDDPAPPTVPDAPLPTFEEVKVAEPVSRQAEVSADPLPTLEEPQIAEPEPPKIIVNHAKTSKSPVHALTPSSNRPRATAAGTSTAGNSANQMTGSSGSGLDSLKTRWSVSSTPPYPFALRRAQVQGNGSVRVTTDANGHVESAVIVQSTGNPMLDDNTCRHAKAAWSGPASASIVVPVTYRLQ